MKLNWRKFEKLFYEIKPAAWVAVSLGILVTTSWGLLSLILSLGILYYASGVVFLRHRFRGSFKNWIQPTLQQTNH